jgi:hypothetical protein
MRAQEMRRTWATWGHFCRPTAPRNEAKQVEAKTGLLPNYVNLGRRLTGWQAAEIRFASIVNAI